MSCRFFILKHYFSKSMPIIVIQKISTNIIHLGGGGMSQRSVIGQRADGSIILIIIEGNLHPRAGATIAELQQLMLDLGAINAINLDGGNSVIMYKDGKVVNEPKGSQSSRNLSSGIIVKW